MANDRPIVIAAGTAPPQDDGGSFDRGFELHFGEDATPGALLGYTKRHGPVGAHGARRRSGSWDSWWWWRRSGKNGSRSR